jgi:hypothetical protein
MQDKNMSLIEFDRVDVVLWLRKLGW